MTLPTNRLAEVMADNQERISVMMSRIAEHTSQGRAFCMTHWDVTKHNDVSFHLEGVLISTLPFVYMKMYPCGTFECSRCNCNVKISHEQHCFWDANTNGIVCSNCKEQMTPRICAMLDFVTEHDFSSIDDCKFIDKTTPQIQIETKDNELQHHLKTINQNMSVEYIYHNNKKIKDIRDAFLAQRVFRKWRRLVECRCRQRVFKVLYHCVELDIHASLVLCQSVRY